MDKKPSGRTHRRLDTVKDLVLKLKTLEGLSYKTQYDMVHTILRWMEKYQPHAGAIPLARRVIRGSWVLPSRDTDLCPW